MKKKKWAAIYSAFISINSVGKIRRWTNSFVKFAMFSFVENLAERC